MSKKLTAISRGNIFIPRKVAPDEEQITFPRTPKYYAIGYGDIPNQMGVAVLGTFSNRHHKVFLTEGWGSQKIIFSDKTHKNLYFQPPIIIIESLTQQLTIKCTITHTAGKVDYKVYDHTQCV